MSNQPIRIGFDARMVAYRQAGIGQYSLNLLRELARLQQAGDSGFRLEIYQSRKEKRPPQSWLPLDEGRVAKRVLWTPPHHSLEQWTLPLELLAGGPDVFHSPDFVPPFRRWTWRQWRLRRVASVITIHDLAFLRFPYLLTGESARYYSQVRRAAHNAERIIAVSASTARDVVEQLDVPETKVKIVYEAANPLFRPLSTAELDQLARQEARLVARLAAGGAAGPAGFLLFVSTLEPRKNLPILLKAYRSLLDRQPDGAPPLVLAGREGWLFEDVKRLAQTLRLDSKLVWLGGVETAELLYLYNRAVLLAMPSLYEGFGLPPLEALACGCPVLVAETSSLPEVVGLYGRKLPPQDVAAWSQALEDGWRNRQHHKTLALTHGPQWAACFSWRRAALETLAVYNEAYQELNLTRKR